MQILQATTRFALWAKVIQWQTPDLFPLEPCLQRWGSPGRSAFSHHLSGSYRYLAERLSASSWYREWRNPNNPTIYTGWLQTKCLFNLHRYTSEKSGYISAHTCVCIHIYILKVIIFCSFLKMMHKKHLMWAWSPHLKSLYIFTVLVMFWLRRMVEICF